MSSDERKQHPYAPVGLTRAIVMGASRLSSLDSHGTPKCLIHVGERPLIHHVLQQLYTVGVDRVVVTLGYKGKEIREYLLENNIFDGMTLEFVEISESVWAARGQAAALLEAKPLIEGEPFILSTADHIFEPTIMKNMAKGDFGGEEAWVLVEEDMEGMVGLPGDAFQLCYKKEDNLVTGVKRHANEGEVEALNAGLYAVKPSFWTYLEKAAEQRPFFTVSEALDLMKDQRLLKAVSTDGHTWFSIETPESLQYALDKHTKFGQSSWFRRQSANNQAGRISITNTTHAVNITPAGKSSLKKSLNNGGDWDEFSVDKWRSAVFTQGSFFKQLYVDSDAFAKHAINDLLGGKDSVTLIEVGSGTGEFITPLANYVRYAIGLEINAKFVQWCNQRIPEEDRCSTMFIQGDAQELISILKVSAPTEIWQTKRLVCCVGNTLGIFPEFVREKALQQMVELAGEDGLVLIIYWNADVFPEAVKYFYGKNPQLCGPFSEEHVDYDTSTLRTPSGYQTHWTSCSEAKQVLKQFGMEEIHVEAKGKGVLVLGRKK
ncbi:Protein kinase domain-containing protein [Balamuthia mandrillaris]